ncbi:hypothetical protein FACS1894122_12270 [Alphaproteobacteria bacterium]|nr:hypothetical protein FACS1894122_12270 [Alphaproteobacteria bacterium]
MFLGIFGNKLYYKELKRRIKTNSLFKGDLSEKNIRTELSKTMCTEETAQIDDKKQNESREKTTDEYYLTAFKNLENSGRNTWNWAAFFGGFLWFGYRKMFINCMLFLFCDVIFFAFCLAFSLLCALCQFGERFPPEIFCSYMILGCAIFRVPLGVFSNKIYYDRVKKNIREDHASLYSTIHAPFIWIRDRFLLRNTREKCTYPPFDFDSNEENIRAELRKTL